MFIPTPQASKWKTEKEDGKIIYEAEFKDGDKERKCIWPLIVPN